MAPDVLCRSKSSSSAPLPSPAHVHKMCVFNFLFLFFLGVYRSFSTAKDFPSQLQMGGESVSKGGVFVIYAILRKSTKSYLTSYKLEEAFFFFLDCGSPEGFDR